MQLRPKRFVDLLGRQETVRGEVVKTLCFVICTGLWRTSCEETELLENTVRAQAAY